MLKWFQVKKYVAMFALVISLSAMLFSSAYADSADISDDMSMDRVELVTKQIELLKNRYTQSSEELMKLQKQHELQVSHQAIEKYSKSLLDKAALDIAVSKSTLDSVNIEVTDSEQTMAWLEKSTQEIENQLNMLNVFGNKAAHGGIPSAEEFRADLKYQQNLMRLERERASYLKKLQQTASTTLQLKRDNYNRLDSLLKSHQLLHIKQEQVKDELAYQELQNRWLQQMDDLNAKLAGMDPSESRKAYSDVEREIYYTNEKANLAYVQSLIARYKNQVQQMKISIFKSSSMAVLNQISDQVVILTKQMNKLDSVLQSRMGVLEKHVSDLSAKKANAVAMADYLAKLSSVVAQYQKEDKILLAQVKSLSEFRKKVDSSIQSELSAREGFPSFGYKAWLDLGREMLQVPTLSFQIFRSLSSNLFAAFNQASLFMWALFGMIEVILVMSFIYLHTTLSNLLRRPSAWREKINSKWLSLQFLQRNFLDVFVISNVIGIFLFFNVPVRNFISLAYLFSVWLVFKAIMTVSRLCLIETTHDTSGHDTRLYHRLKWIILAGGVITACTVFVHQLPLIFELRILCDRLFLFFLVIVSLLLLRSWEVVPNLILSHMDTRHPYFQKVVRLIGVLIPILMLANSLIGLFGFLNLVMTVSWYEGAFMMVLIVYLILRGLLSDGMDMVFNVVIQYTTNGWLWTEAFLKPLDKLLRIALFIASWTVLFLIYGWDEQSPIVERLTRLLHYQLVHVLQTTVTPLNIIELLGVISVFYWTAKWTREFVYRLLESRTDDLGIRNSIAILSQYSVVVLGAVLCMRVLGIDLHALVAVAGLFAFGIGLGLRDLANNFACGFLILLERPLRVGDLVSINGVDGEVSHIGGRAVTVRTWDRMELVVPNTEIFNKSFTNWTAKDNVVRTIVHIKIGRYDNPHKVKVIIQNVLSMHADVLKDPAPEVYLKEISDTLMDFELRFFVNIRQVKSRPSVTSVILMNIWDAFAQHGIKAPFPQHEIFLHKDSATLDHLGAS